MDKSVSNEVGLVALCSKECAGIYRWSADAAHLGELQYGHTLRHNSRVQPCKQTYCMLGLLEDSWKQYARRNDKKSRTFGVKLIVHNLDRGLSMPDRFDTGELCDKLRGHLISLKLMSNVHAVPIPKCLSELSMSRTDTGNYYQRYWYRKPIHYPGAIQHLQGPCVCCSGRRSGRTKTRNVLFSRRHSLDTRFVLWWWLSSIYEFFYAQICSF